MGSPILFQLFTAAKDWITSHPFSISSTPLVPSASSKARIGPPKANPAQNVCKFFAKGKCRFGSKCKNFHPDGERRAPALSGKNGADLGEDHSSSIHPAATATENSSSKSKESTSEENKKQSMRTASDVISRVLWDSSIDTENIKVGYLDRFVGIIEKSFSAFSWEDLASVGANVLAVPKHRIQYFKYCDEIVWDKREQLDNVFGSRGGKIISDVIKEHKNRQGTTKEEGEEKSDVEETATRVFNNEDRPTHFVCIQITQKDVLFHVQGIQDYITHHQPELAEGCLPLTSLHVTMAMLQLKTPAQMASARTVLESNRQYFTQLLPRSAVLKFTGVHHFHERLVYAKVAPNPPLERLSYLLIECFKKAGLKTPGNHAKFTPHMTLVKLTRPMQSNLHTNSIKPETYSVFSEMSIGEQQVRGLHLCSIAGALSEDKFYERCHSVTNSPLNFSPVFPSILSKCVQKLEHSNALKTDATELLKSPHTDESIETLHQLVSKLSPADTILRSKVIIMRGLPGSGKSFLSSHCSEKDVCVCSADDYFVKDGKYEFNQDSLSLAHTHCHEKFLQALEEEREVVVIDNTHSMKWEYESYVHICELLGVEYHVLELPHPNQHVINTYCSRNQHSIDMAAIKTYTDRWEVDQRAVLVPPKIAYPIGTVNGSLMSLLELCKPGDVPESFLSSSAPLFPVYTGIFLTPDSQWKLVSSIPPSHHRMYANHITLLFEPSPNSIKNIGKKVSIKVKGVADDARIQAVTVDLPKAVKSYNEHAHITISSRDDLPPKTSNKMLKQCSVTPFSDSLVLEGVIGVVVRKVAAKAPFYTVSSAKCFTEQIAPRLTTTPSSPSSDPPAVPRGPPQESIAISISTGQQRVTELYVFDFDGTLFDTPDSKQQYEEITGRKWPFGGFFGEPESLLPPLKIKPGPALADYHRHFGRGGSMMAVLTARNQKTEAAVRRVLTDHQVFPDLLLVKPLSLRQDNPVFKVNQLSQLLKRLPHVRVVKFWDDREDNLEAVQEYASKQKEIKFEITNASVQEAAADASGPLSSGTIGPYLRAHGLLPTPEHKTAAQTGIDFIGSQFSTVAGFRGDPSTLSLVFGSHALGRRSDIDLCLLAPPHFSQLDCVEKLGAQLKEKCGITHIHRGYSSRCPRLKVRIHFQETPAIDYDIVFAILATAELFHDSAAARRSILSAPEKFLKSDDRTSRTALSGPLLQNKISTIIEGFVSRETFGAVVEMVVQVLIAQRQKGNYYHCIRTFHIVQLLADFINSQKSCQMSSMKTADCDSLFQEFIAHTALLPTSKWLKLFGEFVPPEYIPRISQTFKNLFVVVKKDDQPVATRYEEMMSRPDFPPQDYTLISLQCSGDDPAAMWALQTVLEARLPTFIRQLLSSKIDVVPDGNSLHTTLCFAVRADQATESSLKTVFKKFWEEFSDYKTRKDVRLELKFGESEEFGSLSSDITKQVTEFASSDSLKEFYFPVDFGSFQRRLVHEAAERVGVKHKTVYNSENKKQVYLYK